MGWTKFSKGGKEFPGCQVSINVDEPDGWIHYLVAPKDEPDPHNNHVHLKANIKGGSGDHEAVWLIAAVKVNGIREINRRKLIEAINRQTGLNLNYK